MFPSLVMPLSVALGLAAGVMVAHRRVPPALSARLLAVTLGVLCVAAVATMWVITLSFVVHVPAVHAWVGWCGIHAGGHGRVPLPIGLLATVLVVLGSGRALRVSFAHRRLRRDTPASPYLEHDAEPFAFTLPGRGGQVVVSTGLVEMLDAEEQAVVLAHEEAHGSCRHDRYLLLSRLATVAAPMLSPLGRRLRFSLERWADELAVSRCGDRRLVATTLGKVALGSAAVDPRLRFERVGVAARVEALLSPPVPGPDVWRCASLLVGVIAVVGFAAFQLHHVGEMLLGLCPT